MIMDFLSEKFALKSQSSKNSDFYMGAGGTLEHVMETLDNESFYSKTSGSKCVQAFNPLQRAEHHVRLDRTSPCQDNNGKSSPQGNSHSSASPFLEMCWTVWGFSCPRRPEAATQCWHGAGVWSATR